MKDFREKRRLTALLSPGMAFHFLARGSMRSAKRSLRGDVQCPEAVVLSQPEKIH
jgi:hypothetical protein